MSAEHIRGSWHFARAKDVPTAIYLSQLWAYAATVLYPMRAVKHLGFFPRGSIGKYPTRAPTPGAGQLFSIRYKQPVYLSVDEVEQASVAEFERGASLYQAMVAPFTRPIEAEAMKLISRLTPSAARILDLGCGPGTQLVRLAGIFQEGEVVGVDLAAEMIMTAWRSAQQAGRRNTAFWQADVAHLPAEFAAQFDLVHCSFAFHHYRDPLEVVREMHRVLVPEGKSFVIDGGTWWANLLATPWARMGDPGWVSFYTGSEFADLFSKAGFSDFYWEELLPGIGVAVGTR
jgi:SAM-dependent methyltransferase